MNECKVKCNGCLKSDVCSIKNKFDDTYKSLAISNEYQSLTNLGIKIDVYCSHYADNNKFNLYKDGKTYAQI